MTSGAWGSVTVSRAVSVLEPATERALNRAHLETGGRAGHAAGTEVVPAGCAVFGGLDAGADVAASALAAKLLVHGELLPVGRGRDFADACSPNDQDGEEAFGGQLEPFFHAGFDFRLIVGVGGDDVCALALEGLVKPEGIGLPARLQGEDGEGCPPVMAIHSLSSTILRPGTWRNTVLRVASMPLWHSVPSPMMLTQRAAASGFERT